MTVETFDQLGDLVEAIHDRLLDENHLLREQLALAEGVCWAADHWSAVHQDSGYVETSPEQRAFLAAFSAWKRMQQSESSVEHPTPTTDSDGT